MFYLDALSPALLKTAPAPAKTGTKPSTSKMAVPPSPDAVTRWLKLRSAYLELRGSSGKGIPRTTNGDVLQLAVAWSRELLKVKPRNDADRVEHAHWQRCLETIKQNAAPKKPNDTYPKNAEFWQECTRRLAIYLQARRVVPGAWALDKRSVVDTLAEVPAVLGNATMAAADTIADVGATIAVSRPAKAALAVLGAAILLPPVIRAVRS